MTGADPRWTSMAVAAPRCPVSPPSLVDSACCSSSNVGGARQQTFLRPGISVLSGRSSGVGAQKCQRHRKPTCTGDKVIRSIEDMVISRPLPNLKQQAPASLGSLGATLAAEHVARRCLLIE